MPIISITSDPEALTITSVGAYPVSVERLWAAWADPRQLERFWGPPEYPATFTRHDLRAGGGANYFMTGPDGERYYGYWRFKTVEPGRGFEAVDGFCDAEGNISGALPSSTLRMAFEATEEGARFTAVSIFDSLEDMETLLSMGALEGYELALAQLDGVLAQAPTAG